MQNTKCRAICETIAIRSKSYNNGKYRRCGVCAIYLPKLLLFCPCCSSMLRNKPRQRRFKTVFNAINNLDIRH